VTFADLHQVLADLPGTAAPGRQDKRLERSYQRLLALYPARYRRVHGDEMLAVLMTAAPEGKTRPALREAADLIGGAVRIWCQPTRRLGWRGVLAVMGAGAAAGFLGGITVAAASPSAVTGATSVEFRTSPGHVTSTLAEADRQAAIVRSKPVLAGALHAVRPAMSVQALRREVHILVVTDRIMVISVQTATASQAVNAASAVARSYVAYISTNVPPADVPVILDPATIEPQPSHLTAIADSAGLGALCGTALGTVIATAASRPRRRLRIT
jgi:hypothetical protein